MQTTGTIKCGTSRHRPALRSYSRPLPRQATWAWVEESIWTERMLAALGSGITRGKWYSLIDKIYRPATLQAAWQQVRHRFHPADISGQAVAAFERDAETCLAELEDALRKGNYRPQTADTSAIAMVKDRIAQTALKMVVEPIFEAMFLQASYGFRPKRGAGDAVRDASRLFRQGRTQVVDIDLNGCLADLAHERIIACVRERISDRHVLALVEGWLREGIMTELAGMSATGELKGAVLSPLLGNVILHPLDARLAARSYRMVRYAGRMVVLCATAQDAQAASREVHAWADEIGLTLAPDNVRVRDSTSMGEGLVFLGHRFEAGSMTLPATRELQHLHSFSGGVERVWPPSAATTGTTVILHS